jgi:mRNA-degrading endonuclease RelE of RelBE toxin-antitoxin system
VPYRIEYSASAESHLRELTARQQAVVLATIEQQLTHQPTAATRNRKPLRPNLVGGWALRIGDIRVYYDVEPDPESVVHVRAIGIKERNRVRIGRDQVDL